MLDNRFRSASPLLVVALLALLGLGLAACDEGPAEEAGREAGAAIDEAGEAIGDAVDDATD